MSPFVVYVLVKEMKGGDGDGEEKEQEEAKDYPLIMSLLILQQTKKENQHEKK